MTRISDSVIKDHRELEEYHQKILDATTEDEKTRWQNQFVWELARHSAGEEIVLYPVIEEVLPNGKEIADKDRQEHQKAKDLLFKFQAMHTGDPAFSPTLRQLWKELSEHIKGEEEVDLVELEKAINAEKSAEMAKSFQRTKMLVPTRAHPSAPDKPPFETVVGLLTAPIDKLLDVFQRFPKDE